VTGAPEPVEGPRRFVLAAGGTGGHLFPAQALAERLVAAGAAAVCLATDRRTAALAAAAPPPGVAIARVRAGRLGGGPLKSAYGLAEIALGIVEARRLLHRIDPDAVVGFGGYPSVPTMLAAWRLGYPTLIHEQNAVLGRANRLLARRVERIATGFAETAGLPPPEEPPQGGVSKGVHPRAVYTGNPVRPAIRAVADTAYRPPLAGKPIAVVVLGGSQGARIFADVVPPALAALPSSLRAALRVSQQARPEDCARVSAQLRQAGIAAEVESFFGDVPERLAGAQLAICRAGASTVAELAAIGRPALLVPYPHAADDHQLANARAVAAAGAGWVLPQSTLSVPMLTRVLTARLADPAGLELAAAQARGLACEDAAERLAAAILDLLPAAAGHWGRRKRAA
jgi:UDP-N-acetylglucosamine--N-acetylmuramyl-(pentapeptide) pyrophosphoryl-undecaprenol N-acetylglucosamine transferase